MAQGIMGGATSYEEQSLKDILDDINIWVEYTERTRDFISSNRKKLKDIGFWDKIPFNFMMTIETTLSYCSTIIGDLGIVRQAILSNVVTTKEVRLIRKIGTNSIQYNREYGRTYKEESRWKDYGNPDFRLAEEIYRKGRDYFVTLQDATNVAARMEDYMSEYSIHNSINIGGDATNVYLVL